MYLHVLRIYRVTETRQEARDPKTIAEKVKPLAEHGVNQHREDRGLDIIKSKTTGGTSSSYLTARIARDCPEEIQENFPELKGTQTRDVATDKERGRTLNLR
jgi:hypothetical protein